MGMTFEAEVQILTELVAADRLLQVLVRRGDDPDIDLDRPRRPQALHLLLLQHTEDFRLRLRAHVADFVEEDRPAVRLLELADLLLSAAPVNDPFSWPNNSDSISSSGWRRSSPG
jgi:hypothetical protein